MVDLGFNYLDLDHFELDYLDPDYFDTDNLYQDAENNTSVKVYNYTCTMSSLLESPYATSMNFVLLMYMSSKHDLVTMGDLLQFSHDDVNTYLQNKQLGYKGLTQPVEPDVLFWPYFPDQMVALLKMEANNLTADEIGRYANHYSFGLPDISLGFLSQFYSGKCENLLFTSETDFYKCRDEMFHSNLSHALRVLKYSVQAAHSRIHPHEQAAVDFRLAQNLANENYYKKILLFFNWDNKFLQYDPAIRYCYFGNNKDDDIYERSPHDNACIHFRRTFGVKGISYEFNPSQIFWDTYSKKNAYNKMIYSEIFQDDTHYSKETNISLDSGQILDFFIYPDSLEKCCMDEISSPELAIHHHTKIPSNFMKLQRGYR